MQGTQRHPAAATCLRDDHEVHDAYVQHGPALYHFVLRGLGDPGAAEDVVQETFLRAWRAADRFDPALASLRGWLFAIARNTALDHARAARVRPWQGRLLDPLDVVEAAEADVDPYDALLRSWEVHDALDRLSEDHRTAIVQTFLQDRPYAEVAASLGIPVGTLRSRVFHGLKALRAAMQDREVTP